MVFIKGDPQTLAASRLGNAAKQQGSSSKRLPIGVNEMRALAAEQTKITNPSPTPTKAPSIANDLPQEPSTTTQPSPTHTPIPPNTPKSQQVCPPPANFHTTKMSPPTTTPSYYLQSLQTLNDLLSRQILCPICREGSFSIASHTKVTVAFVFILQCQNEECGHTISFASSPKLPDQKVFESNLLFSCATTTGALGQQQMNNFLNCFGHPSVTNQSWVKGRDKMGELIAKLWVDVKEENLREELYKMNANGGVAFDEEGRMLLEVTFDGTWSTRGYSSMLGFATYFGVYSKKPLFTAYRCKICRVCECAERNGKPPPTHKCPLNWRLSSGAMEANMAVQGIEELARKINVNGVNVGVRVGLLVGDGDAKIDYHLRESLPDHLKNIERYLDVNHIVKNFTKRLLKVVKTKIFKGSFSHGIAMILKRAFAAEIHHPGTWSEKKEKKERNGKKMADRYDCKT